MREKKDEGKRESQKRNEKPGEKVLRWPDSVVRVEEKQSETKSQWAFYSCLAIPLLLSG